MNLRIRGWLINAALLLTSLLIVAAAIEGIIGYALSHPEILGGRPLALARNFYLRKDRHIVQLRPDCAVYDPEVTYTLKPDGRCTIANREYTIEYAANRAGIRDDDATMAKPALVVLGDSHAMGWGVAAADAFPKVMQRDLGVPVLNAAVSSYGTAREFALMQRLGAKDAKAIVIQYCDNDYLENRYLTEHGHLDITPESLYRALVAEHAADTRYYPFKYVRNLFSVTRLAPPVNADEAHYFLEVLLYYGAVIAGRPIVVIELNSYNLNGRRFVDEVNALLRQPRYTALASLVSTVDVSPLLTEADYYLLDDHMRSSGHVKVATAIEVELKRRGIFAP